MTIPDPKTSGRWRATQTGAAAARAAAALEAAFRPRAPPRERGKGSGGGGCDIDGEEEEEGRAEAAAGLPRRPSAGRGGVGGGGRSPAPPRKTSRVDGADKLSAEAVARSVMCVFGISRTEAEHRQLLAAPVSETGSSSAGTVQEVNTGTLRSVKEESVVKKECASSELPMK